MKQDKPKKKKVYDFQRSLNYCMWLLSRQVYSKANLRQKLKKKEATDEVIERVILRLEELNFVDDGLFAENYVRSRKRNKGRIGLRQELFRKGLSEEDVEAALATLKDDEQIEAATELLGKNIWRFKGDFRQRSSKAYAFLARRGYSGDVVRAVLEQADFFADDELL